MLFTFFASPGTVISNDAEGNTLLVRCGSFMDGTVTDGWEDSDGKRLSSVMSNADLQAEWARGCAARQHRATGDLILGAVPTTVAGTYALVGAAGTRRRDA